MDTRTCGAGTTNDDQPIGAAKAGSCEEEAECSVEYSVKVVAVVTVLSKDPETTPIVSFDLVVITFDGAVGPPLCVDSGGAMRGDNRGLCALDGDGLEPRSFAPWEDR